MVACVYCFSFSLSHGEVKHLARFGLCGWGSYIFKYGLVIPLQLEAMTTLMLGGAG